MRARGASVAGAAVVVAVGVAGLVGTAGPAAGQEPCPGAGAPPCATPTPMPTPAAAVLTLESSRSAVRFDGRSPGRLTFTGTVTAGGSPVAGAAVLFTGRSAAYGRTVVRRELTTDAQGRFTIRLRPPANALFQATVAAGQPVAGKSPARRVLVSPRLVLANAGGIGVLQVRLRAQAPLRVPSAGGGRPRRVRAGGARRAVFYVRLRGETRYRRFAAAPLSAAACHRRCERKATVVVRKPSLLRRLRAVGACTPGLAFRGFGETTPCGAARRRF